MEVVNYNARLGGIVDGRVMFNWHRFLAEAMVARNFCCTHSTTRHGALLMGVNPFVYHCIIVPSYWAHSWFVESQSVEL